MNDLTQLVLTSGLLFLLGFFVLVFPLIFMMAGNLLPWLEKMAVERQADAGILSVRPAPLARRTAAGRQGSTARRKVAVTPTTGAKAPAARKTAKKKATRKTAKSKSAAATKKAPAKKSATPKTAAKKTARRKSSPSVAKKDPKLGRVYTKKPPEADNLKKISGVGKVLEGKLHADGIYTYRQIADWTPKQMETFGERLSFKGRIEREGWKQQAKSLHAAKYKEKT